MQIHVCLLHKSYNAIAVDCITFQRVFVISLEKPDVPENKMHQICVTCEEGEFDIPLLHNVNILICNTLIL